MKRASVLDLADDPFDILVIGGGIYGMMAARDAALRGLRVALVERADFGGGSSHNSLKVMHGGIRYVQHLDFGRLRASARERAFWQAAAPDNVIPTKFVIPLFGYGARGPAAFAAAAALYGLASAGLRGREYPAATVMSARSAREALGELAPNGMTGGGVWSDGQIEDINRLHLAVLQSAVTNGAMVANYVEATTLIRDGDRVTGAVLRDAFTGQEGQVKAAVTICSAGAKTSRLIETAIPAAPTRLPSFARAMNLVIDRTAPKIAKGVVSQEQSDAIVDRGGRMYFFTPWRGRTIVGTHESQHTDPDQSESGAIHDFLADLARAAPHLDLRPEDVLWVHRGLIPAEVDDGPGRVRRMTRGTLVDHSDADSVGGLISVVGVKYTTARLIAERAVSRACRQLDRGPSAEELSFRTPLPRAETLDVDATTSEALEKRISTAFRDEMAITLADVLIRRTPLAESGQLRTGSDALIGRALDIAGRVAGWDASRKKSERQTLARELAVSLSEETDASSVKR